MANRDAHFDSRSRDSKRIGKYEGNAAAPGEALYKYTREAGNTAGPAKSPVLFERNAYRFLLVSLAAWLTIAANIMAQGPQWWFDRGAVDDSLPPNDYAPVTQGQLKWLATNAFCEMETYFGAGSNVTAVVGAFSGSNNYYPANLGQVKYVAKPFYDRLYELNLTNTFPANMPGYYPWGNASSTNDYALANIGQVKYVFSFDSAKDSDGDRDISADIQRRSLADI